MNFLESYIVYNNSVKHKFEIWLIENKSKMVTQYNTHKQAAFAHLENVPSLHASKLSAGELLEYNDDRWFNQLLYHMHKFVSTA